MTNLIDNILAWIERTSSKVHGWAWDKRWKSRDPNEWIKGYNKWKYNKQQIINETVPYAEDLHAHNSKAVVDYNNKKN